MRAIVVMYDSLVRRMLPPWGAPPEQAPNFARLATRSATFDTCYAGSMPCMPARREMHTGRYNFLHRSWGPIEPFDDSVYEILAKQGVHSHLITDHQHYWEDGGATYHTRFTTHETFRGQEGDAWMPFLDLLDRDVMQQYLPRAHTQDQANRTVMTSREDMPMTKVFDAGLDFLERNAGADDWLLQIETFDPHEPFTVPGEEGDDWPAYGPVTQDAAGVEAMRAHYLKLLGECDRHLGRVLDAMDRLELWQDTMLIVCTDHGFLLGERGYWGKNVLPWYDEAIHTPFFLWDPKAGVAGERRQALVQTIDIAPTLLEAFGVAPTADMQGKPLGATVRDDTPVREAALFGVFGSHVSVTDGRHVYMRAPLPGNTPLEEHSLMPTRMRGFASGDDLARASLHPGFAFTKGMPVLRYPGRLMRGPAQLQSLLFDLQTDPGQQTPLEDKALETRMAGHLVELMRASDAPPGQYRRLGLPETGPVEDPHLALLPAQD
ncbi:sulfatase [Pseudooceanicola sp. CBS1P-1]|uniref:Sulfatase-like hydrolase/transferase n=1 Tax=Pseudooceanicola albus TaxID=2692189 RepID=A0A6L7FZJ2_9RHOB|nr:MULTISPECIES: sulfatase [Pseudooceanicola]MBT9382310.1 sulfatase [Pseudooceanicola endophyticus]MXN16852.1 sulfatase-like hydrolase/transferase [Pseudooceanicola albus]